MRSDLFVRKYKSKSHVFTLIFCIRFLIYHHVPKIDEPEVTFYGNSKNTVVVSEILFTLLFNTPCYSSCWQLSLFGGSSSKVATPVVSHSYSGCCSSCVT